MILADITARVMAAAGARFRPRRPAPALARPVQAPAVPHAPASALAQWVVVIGVSTGGPRTLAEVLPKLPASLPAAVLIVQHLPASFTRAFAERLDSLSALRVKEAEQGEPIVCGTAYVGPGGIHLGVRRGRLGSSAAIDLLPEPARSVHRPSVDVMMRSALEVFGTRMIGVLLTGMGSDGADAMVAARRAGAKTIAESEESAVIFGMPREAIARGGASIVAPAAAVADEILKILPS